MLVLVVVQDSYPAINLLSSSLEKMFLVSPEAFGPVLSTIWNVIGHYCVWLHLTQ